MPTGILINSAAVALGGACGALFASKLSEYFKSNMNTVFGVCAMGMGISLILNVQNITALMCAIIFGTSIGLIVRLGEKIQTGAKYMQRVVQRFIKPQNTSLSPEEYTAELVTIIVLFCASGTGIYGSIISGMIGDHSILIAKALLDFFTAMIFACVLGATVSAIAIPQLIVHLLLFFLAGFIYPLTTPYMIGDFKACGGLLLLASGLRMNKIKMYPTADMLPAMVLVMPVSYLWTEYLLPLFG